MACKKAKQKQETTLAPHRTPTLSALLERAKSSESAQAVKGYLDAGGSPNAVVGLQGRVTVLQLPLLANMVLTSDHLHREFAECVRLLVNAGADVNASFIDPDYKLTAVTCAAEWGCCTVMLDALLRAGADPRVRTAPDCQTALHVAAQKGTAECCELLLAQGADTLLEAKDRDGSTALLLASSEGTLENVRMLIQHGADVNTTGSAGETPLMVACAGVHPKLVVVLLEAGADIIATDRDGESALFDAVRRNSVALVQLLLNNGADITITDIKGETALFKAVYKGHVFMMELLIKRGFSTTAVDNDGSTLLMVAAVNEQKAAAEWLIQHGLAVNAVNNGGATALHYATLKGSSGDTSMLELLLANGIDVQKCTNDGHIALDIAVNRSNLEFAKVLIAAGADVNHCISVNVTSLHIGIIRQHVAIVQLLLENGATEVMNDVLDVQGAMNGTALMMCTTVDTVKMLLAAGADVH
eukprot:4571-Heterococcus_DN1.PRE.1